MEENEIIGQIRLEKDLKMKVKDLVVDYKKGSVITVADEDFSYYVVAVPREDSEDIELIYFAKSRANNGGWKFEPYCPN